MVATVGLAPRSCVGAPGEPRLHLVALQAAQSLQSLKRGESCWPIIVTVGLIARNGAFRWA
jgi:hypothetical protein